MTPTAATRLFALVGDPVAHSLSPVFQNAAFAAAGIDAVYLALRCGGAEVGALVRGIALAGGGGNVTVPHKERVADVVDRRTDAVDRTGACNTFWLSDGEVRGDNTDVEGARVALTAVAAESRRPVRRALVLGAGGAASAVIAALSDLGAVEIGVLGRSPARARALAERFAGTGVAVLGDATDAAGTEWDLVVNATPLGLHPGELPPVGTAHVHAALDLVYRPGGTAWVRALRGRGIVAADGTEMLLAQGAAAFRRWFGREPEADAMRAALVRATAG